MDIEPLKTYLQNKENIWSELYDFLDELTKNHIMSTEYIVNGIYIGDKLFFIKKNTLELEYVGNVYFINDHFIGLKLSKYRNVTLDSKKYYIFRKIKEKTKREIMNDLLKQL